MSRLPNRFKEALRRRERQVGIWLTMASSTATEICAGAGFDWMLLDMEHAPNELPDVVGHLRAATGGPSEVVVRAPWNEPVMIKRLLDVGARSIMFPYVQNAEEARRAVASTRYPPEGMRGVSSTSRATAYGRAAGYFSYAAEEIAVVVQIETPEAVKNLAEIASVAGVDGVFIGPNDLAANMGFIGAGGRDEVKDVVANALTRILASGKAPGILNFKPSEAKSLFEQGFSFIAVGGDTNLLAQHSSALAASFRA